jgi:hypothetical protein
MSRDLEEAFQWIAKSSVLSNDNFEIFFLGDDDGNNPKIDIISKKMEILASASANTYSEAFVKAVKQVRERFYTI